jgi:hypothetical protein
MGFCAVLLDHYEFRDSTGAEYRLEVNTNGIWSSKESIYVYYDPSSLGLHFTDGSVWVFGCTSAGTEQDSGTMLGEQPGDSHSQSTSPSSDQVIVKTATLVFLSHAAVLSSASAWAPNVRKYRSASFQF